MIVAIRCLLSFRMNEYVLQCSKTDGRRTHSFNWWIESIVSWLLCSFGQLQFQLLHSLVNASRTVRWHRWAIICCGNVWPDAYAHYAHQLHAYIMPHPRLQVWPIVMNFQSHLVTVNWWPRVCELNGRDKTIDSEVGENGDNNEMDSNELLLSPQRRCDHWPCHWRYLPSLHLRQINDAAVWKRPKKLRLSWAVMR
jgi:hypothetical protein